MPVGPDGLSLPFVRSGFFGEPDSFSMYGSNRVKRRPSPYEMEITDGESVWPLRWLLGGSPSAEGGELPHGGTRWDLNPKW